MAVVRVLNVGYMPSKAVPCAVRAARPVSVAMILMFVRMMLALVVVFVPIPIIQQLALTILLARLMTSVLGVVVLASL